MTPAAYAMLARAELSNFIERSTRFTPGDVGCSEASSFVAEFRVEVQYPVRGVLSEVTYPGRIEHDPSDLRVESHDEYNLISNSLLKEAEGHLQCVRDLGKTIAAARYADHVQQIQLHRYHRRALLTYTCPSCSGCGNVTCSSCDGNGGHTCSFCNGSGSCVETEWETDHHGHSHGVTRHRSCSYCNGSGRQTCSSCHGSGTETCGACQGLGELTQIGIPLLVVDPVYRLASVTPNDPDVVYALETYATLPCVSDGWATLRHRIIEVGETQRRVVETVDFSCPFFKGTAAVGRVTGRMVVFGNKCTVSDAGNLTESLVRPDLDVLRAAIGQLRWYDVPMLRHVQEIAHLFMESEVHQSAVLYAPARWNAESGYEELANRLSRSLSPNYLRDTIQSIETVATWTSGSHEYYVGLGALAIGVSFFLYQVAHERPVVAVAGAVGIYFLSSWVRRWMTASRLRWIGGQSLVDFVARRGLIRKLWFGW